MNWRRIALLVILSAGGIAVSYLVFKPEGAWGVVADLCVRSLTCVYSSVLTYLIVVRSDSGEKAKTKVRTQKTKTKTTSGKTKSDKTKK